MHSAVYIDMYSINFCTRWSGSIHVMRSSSRARCQWLHLVVVFGRRNGVSRRRLQHVELRFEVVHARANERAVETSVPRTMTDLIFGMNNQLP